MTTRVLIVDDQSLVRAGFRLILESQPDFAVVGEAPDGEQAVALARRHRPEVVLMDIRMPRMDGLEATRRILADGLSGCRIVMLTTFDLDEYVYAALRVGACGFLLKDVTPEQLIASVRLVAAGDALLAPSITRRLIERYASRGSELSRDLSSLTEREVEVLRLMAQGLANQAIGEQLFVSEATVKTHVAHILDKLHVENRVQAVVAAYESRLVTPGEPA
ncbi:MAG TPA: response regulator transcription factor [Candidatus Dormibacteraeota bacterium]